MSQPSDKAIGNVNFPQFRADLNDGLDALFTNNSGSSEPAALANSDFAHYLDTTDNTFKIKDSTSGGTGTYLDLYKLQGGEVRLQGNITDTLPAIGSFDTAYAQAQKSLQVDSAGTLSYGFAAPYRHHAQILDLEDTDADGTNAQGRATQNVYAPRRFNWVEFDTGEQVSINTGQPGNEQQTAVFGAKSANQVKNGEGTKVKLKAGTHFITAYAGFYDVARIVLRFYDATNQAYVGKPSLVHWASHANGQDCDVASISSRLTFAVDTDIQVHQIIQRTSNSTLGFGLGYSDITTLTDANVEVVFSKMEIWTV
tara:strand:+ start:3695 stop:4630 length:936 start_codon:yes stop_codon:yes gene_type:complete